jgi:hypothetical protein
MICFQILRNIKCFKIQYEAFKGEAEVTKSFRTLTVCTKDQTTSHKPQKYSRVFRKQCQ